MPESDNDTRRELISRRSMLQTAATSVVGLGTVSTTTGAGNESTPRIRTENRDDITEPTDTRDPPVPDSYATDGETADVSPPTGYTLTVVETGDDPDGNEIGSVTVNDPTPLGGEHIGFATLGENQSTGDHGVADHLRFGNGEVIEDWEEPEPLDAYDRTAEGGGRFERFFAQTTSGETSLRMFSGCCGDQITSKEKLLNLNGRNRIKVDLLQGTDRSDAFAHKTRVLLGTDAAGGGGIGLGLINDGSERTAGARITTPNGEGRIKFEPVVDRFYTYILDINRSGSEAPDVTGDGNPARDPDDDGLYEDVNGDGDATPGDSTVLFDAIFDGNTAVTENVPLFDFNGDGSVTPGDATVLFNEIF